MLDGRKGSRLARGQRCIRCDLIMEGGFAPIVGIFCNKCFAMRSVVHIRFMLLERNGKTIDWFKVDVHDREEENGTESVGEVSSVPATDGTVVDIARHMDLWTHGFDNER